MYLDKLSLIILTSVFKVSLSSDEQFSSSAVLPRSSISCHRSLQFEQLLL